MTRTFTSVYQLLPVFKCLEQEDGSLVRVAEAEGIPNLDPVKAAAALGFHREIEEAVERNRNDDGYRQSGYETFLVVGSEQPTNQSARLRGSEVELLKSPPTARTTAAMGRCRASLRRLLQMSGDQEGDIVWDSAHLPPKR